MGERAEATAITTDLLLWKKKIQEVLELIGGSGHDHECVIVEAIHMIKESKSSDYLDCNNFSYHSEFASWESSPLGFLL